MFARQLARKTARPVARTAQRRMASSEPVDLSQYEGMERTIR